MRFLVVADGARGAEIAGALAEAGDVTVSGSMARGRDGAREAPDVLVLAEEVGGRLSHDLALLAEWRNPLVATVLLSDRGAEEAEELWELLPSLQAILGTATRADVVARVAAGTGCDLAEAAARRLAGRLAVMAEAAEVEAVEAEVGGLPSFLRARPAPVAGDAVPGVVAAVTEVAPAVVPEVAVAPPVAVAPSVAPEGGSRWQGWAALLRAASVEAALAAPAGGAEAGERRLHLA